MLGHFEPQYINDHVYLCCWKNDNAVIRGTSKVPQTARQIVSFPVAKVIRV